MLLTDVCLRALSRAYKEGERLVEAVRGVKTAGDAAWVERLRAEVTALGPPSTPSESASLTFWQENERELLEYIHKKDPRQFLRWPVILKTMFVERSPYIAKEFAYLRRHAQWATRWRAAIAESAVGAP